MTAPSMPALWATSSRTNETPPISGRVTLPDWMSWGTILWMVSTGMAKPTPLEVGVAIIVFMPMSSPAELSSGPPELPGLIEASVWIMSRIVTSPAPTMLRPKALTMPVVTVWSKPNGLPMAMTFLADLEVVRRADRDRTQAGDLLAELEDGDVLRRIAADERGLDLFLIRQADHVFVALVDDMEVGDDVPLVVPDEARPAAPRHGLVRTNKRSRGHTGGL